MKRKKTNNTFSCIIAISLLLLSYGCIDQTDLAVFQKEASVPNFEWTYKYQPSFSFQIKDTSALYDLFITIRHTNRYPYNNLWLLIHSAYQGAKPTEKRVELPLTDETGQWLGAGMDDIYQHRIPIQQNAKFDSMGTYHITLEQNMRINPLPNVMAVGLRVEKTTP
ncbi:MAG TPA: gliding motility lipoprotein GldH [Chitinophagaceae bacterium]|nr:gliding motility lipoprotein GldH [Chitinophagaceae bacterium]